MLEEQVERHDLGHRRVVVVKTNEAMTKTRVYRDRDKTSETLRNWDRLKTKTEAGRGRVKTNSQ